MNMNKNSFSKLYQTEYVFNLPAMIKILLAMLLIVTGNYSFAQHIQYSDKSKTKTDNIKPAKPAKVVYHDWPDRCPALSGSIPVLTNYVPEELVLKLTEIYKGHLYSISSLKAVNDKLQYKLKVCIKGELKFEYADETGTIITK
jgi:hypothetical protein